MSVSQISGLVSGLDTKSLIDAMVAARSGPVVNLQRRQAEKTAELTAWQSFDAVLLSLKIETERLGNRNLWNQLLVTPSDEDHLSVTADNTATLGSLDLFVRQLATSHQVQSDAYGSTDELVGSGTFSLTINSVQQDLTVAAGSTVADLAEQINDADLGVNASLIRSESAGANTYHLVITAQDTGAASAFVADGTGLSGGTTPDFTVYSPRTGQDAIVEFGGEGGLQVHSSTNTFTDILDGVDVTARKTHAEGDSTQVTIARDEEGLAKRVTEFVDRFNAVIEFKNSQFSFDADVGGRPVLMGSSTLISITSQIRSKLLGPVAGLSDATFTTLAGVGITAGSDGTLSFDEGKFSESLEEDYDGVANLFRANAGFDTAGVEWLQAPDGLDLGNRSFELIVTQAAARATLTGSEIDLGAGFVVDATNDTFQISVDGVRSEDVKLAHGTYTNGTKLAQAIVAAVDQSEELGALGIRASWVPGSGTTGALELSTTKYGSASSMQLLNAGTDFGTDFGFGSVMNVKAEGVDVAGTIAGITASGNGRVLKLDDDVEELGGLSFRVTSDGTTIPTTITANFTEGVGRSATRDLLRITDTADGTLARMESSIQSLLDQYARDLVLKQEQLEVRRARLERRFAGLESTLGNFQGQSQFLAAQLGSLSGNNR